MLSPQSGRRRAAQRRQDRGQRPAAPQRRRAATWQRALGRVALRAEAPGIRELAGCDVAADALIEAWTERLAQSLGFDFFQTTLRDDETALANRLLAEKYAQAGWNQRR